MATGTKQTDKHFVADLARGGFAESLSPSQRRAIHIQTRLDSFLNTQLQAGKQVVLTGNPGDGKTQHIFIEQDQFPKSEGYYYLRDASEYSDYRGLLEEWKQAYDTGQPGILAINDGPLYDMATHHREKVPFLETVITQLESQVVYGSEEHEAEGALAEEIVVVDLNNRNILVPDIIDQAINQFAGEFAKRGHDHSGQCHVQRNARQLAEVDTIRHNLREMLILVGQMDVHVTIRDLINFLCYIITAGRQTCQTTIEEPDRYYNLAFTGEGKLFDLFRERFDPEQLTHPFVDSALWTVAEEAIGPRDTEDAREETEEEYLRRKREFLFADQTLGLSHHATGRSYESTDLYREIDREFLARRNGNFTNETHVEEIIERVNGYFSRGSRRSDLQLWLSHRYRSKSSLALVSRTDVSKRKLRLRRPRLHPVVRDAISFQPEHMVLEYTDTEAPIRLRIDQELYQTLRALDASVPYTLRDRDEEQQLLEFMEDVEYHETYSENRGTVSIKDTETGRVVELEIEDDHYRT
jgi:hypothetical protein